MVNDHTNRFTWAWKCRKCSTSKTGLRVKAEASRAANAHWASNHYGPRQLWVGQTGKG